jgi:hypothetical protein
MIGWYINRLKTISIAEFPYRIKQFIKNQYERYFDRGKFPAKITVVTKKDILSFLYSPEELYPDSINIYGTAFRYTEQNINWHEDINSGERFPLSFSKTIKIRDNSNLSAKNVWEINRLQFLSFIALNYRKTGSDIYLNQFIHILNSWIDNNPYLTGINWYSNIEINIRLITWFFCWQILDADKLIATNPEFKDFVDIKWIPAIFQHCRHSFSNPSKYSSSNNHLISEHAGLFIASSLWQFKESEKWNRYSKRGLEKEILRQHSENGINKEEAAEYIQFITDFFLIAYIVGENTNNPFSENYKIQFRKILDYICNFLDMNGHFPQYGDEDDGKCLILDFDKNFNNFKSLLTSGAILFKDPILKSRSNGFDIKNQFLFGETGKKVFESIPEINYVGSSKYYEDEGHFIFRKNENGSEIYLHFDAAPLGFLSIAAHGHADALSFTLNVDGQPIFVDPGTYTYHTEPTWRSYFIGTLAHNTIRINQHDQAVNGGPTLWTKHYKASVIDLDLNDDNNRVKATHNGYVKDGAQHIREILFDSLKNEFQILDTIVVKKNRKTIVEIPFHTHPNVSINKQSANCYLISKDSVRKTELYIDEKLNPVVIKGQMEPQILGWYSSSFAKKEATNVIYCKTQIESTTIFKFIIKIV